MQFSLSSTECEILLKFEQSSSLQSLAESLGKDISVVSRNLKVIGEKSEVLEKKSGRWVLTNLGKELNEWTREAIFSQNQILQNKKTLLIATTREFASRIFIPHSREIIGDENVSVSIISTDEGIEKYILSGKADFGFDCGHPKSKLISYKRIARESFCLIASPDYILTNKIKNMKDLNITDKLNFSRIANSVLDPDMGTKSLNATFNDISILRSACIEGFGWSILPFYSVRKEIKEKKLKIIPGLKMDDERMGIWWLKGRKSLSPWIKKAEEWLLNREVDLSGKQKSI